MTFNEQTVREVLSWYMKIPDGILFCKIEKNRFIHIGTTSSKVVSVSFIENGAKEFILPALPKGKNKFWF